MALADTVYHIARTYEANIRVFFDIFTFTLSGRVAAEIVRAAGRYRVTITGGGPGVTARTESTGIMRDGRFMPTETRSSHTVRGRENRAVLSYDYAHTSWSSITL